jgi:hypothetical protein
MVDIRSMAASSHPSHRQQDTKGEATRCSEVGRSHHMSGCAIARIAAATSPVAPALGHHGCDTAAGCSCRGYTGRCMPTSQQPPGPHASPSAAEQWRYDVDQLIVTAINTPPHGGRRANHSGGRHEPSAAHSCMPTDTRAPLTTRAPMT